MPGTKASVLVAVCALLSAAPGHAARSIESLKSADPLTSAPPPAAQPVPTLPAAGPVAPPPAPISILRVRPDASKTPGRLCTTDDPDFLEFRYPERIPYCRRNVSQEEKARVAAAYGVPRDRWSDYEFDHLIPLAIGGSSQDDNIWPQPRGADESDGKDKLEYSLYQQLAAGAITQADAVRRMMAWFESKGITLARAR